MVKPSESVRPFGVSRYSLPSRSDAIRFRTSALLLAAGRLSAFQAGHTASCCMMRERPWVLVTAEGRRWLLLLLSPLLSVAVRVTTVPVEGMARAWSGQAPACC